MDHKLKLMLFIYGKCASLVDNGQRFLYISVRIMLSRWLSIVYNMSMWLLTTILCRQVL